MTTSFCRLWLFIIFLFASFSAAGGEEIVCRYCEQGRAHGWLPAGVELEGRFHYAPDRQVDVLHIKLDVTPDFDQRTVAGTASITAKPISKPVELLRLDAIDIHVKEVRCEGAEVEDFISSRKELQIAFAKPVPPGAKITLHIDYSAEPKAGLYFRTPELGYPKTDTHLWTQGETHEAPHWFPCFDYPNERSSTEIICHVPREMTVLSNGRKMEEDEENGMKRVRWLQEKPHVNYLICLVAGHFKKLEKQHGEIPLGFYTQPTLAEHAPNSFRDTAEIMAFFEEEIGVAYPWVKYDQVTILDFTAGGMENTSLTTLTHRTIFSEATENIRTTRGLDAHEMAHQWFGDYVTCKDWSHLWLNEGFATFYTHLYEGRKFGRDAMLYGLHQDAANRILTQKNDKKPIVYNEYKNPMEQFDYRSYPKGSWVLHMLRCQLGEELYRDCIKTYLERHALSSVVSDDLRKVIEEKSGQPMDRFFDQWLYHARHPDLKITYNWLAKERLAKVSIRQTQKVDKDVLLFHFPTKLRFIVEGEAIDHAVKVQKEEEEFYVPLKAQPSIVRFDPEYTVLADISFDKPNPLLKAQIENKSDMIGRLLACQTLAERKTQESAALLKKTLETDEFFGVRIAAARALARHESREANKVLESNWQEQTDARVRLAVVESMVDRYREETPALIASILKSENNPAILAAAIKALGLYHGETTSRQLIAMLHSDSFRNELAAAAIEAIRKQNDPVYKDPLMEVLRDREEFFSSRDFGEGLQALAHISQPLAEKKEVRDFLLKYVNHTKTEIRTAAMGALGALGDATAVSVLETFVRSDDRRISQAAKKAADKLREAAPSGPQELIELRKEIAAMKSNSEKLQAELESLREQWQAQEQAGMK